MSSPATGRAPTEEQEAPTSKHGSFRSWLGNLRHQLGITLRSWTHRRSDQTQETSMPARNRKILTNRDEIREWAENWGVRPALVSPVGIEEEGIISLAFPGMEEETLQDIGWEEWFDQFDDNGLALVYMEQAVEGAPSLFTQLVPRRARAQSQQRQPRRPTTARRAPAKRPAAKASKPHVKTATAGTSKPHAKTAATTSKPHTKAKPATTRERSAPQVKSGRVQTMREVAAKESRASTPKRKSSKSSAPAKSRKSSSSRSR